MFLVNTLLLFCSHIFFTPYHSLRPYSPTDAMTDRETNTLAACGLEELFSSCAIVSVFVVVAGNSFRCYLPTIPVVPLCLIAQISVLVVAGKGSSCFLVTDHNQLCRCVSFWLQREIVFGCTVSKYDSYLVSLIERESSSKCVYFV
jgi:hypothetical protein